MDDDCFVMLLKLRYFFLVVVRELSTSLWIKIFHQLHKLAKDFELIEPLEFVVVCNVFDVVVVEL
jgi:hypothetical protein